MKLALLVLVFIAKALLTGLKNSCSARVSTGCSRFSGVVESTGPGYESVKRFESDPSRGMNRRRESRCRRKKKGESCPWGVVSGGFSPDR